MLKPLINADWLRSQDWQYCEPADDWFKVVPGVEVAVRLREVTYEFFGESLYWRLYDGFGVWQFPFHLRTQEQLLHLLSVFVPPEEDPEPDKPYVLQNTGAGYVGNALLFYGKKGQGYTTDVDGAERMTREECLDHIRGTRGSHTWQAWRYADVLQACRIICDSQRLPPADPELRSVNQNPR